MADILREVFGQFSKRFRDMGDGTHAEVVAIGDEIAVSELAAVDGAAADVNAPAANTPAVVTYAGVVGAQHCISGVAWSYAGDDPTNGNLAVADGAVTIFTMDITTEGAGFVMFPSPKRGRVATAMVVTLAAGGAAVTGKVSVLNHWTE